MAYDILKGYKFKELIELDTCEHLVDRKYMLDSEVAENITPSRIKWKSRTHKGYDNDVDHLLTEN